MYYQMAYRRLVCRNGILDDQWSRSCLSWTLEWETTTEIFRARHVRYHTILHIDVNSTTGNILLCWWLFKEKYYRCSYQLSPYTGSLKGGGGLVTYRWGEGGGGEREGSQTLYIVTTVILWALAHSPCSYLGGTFPQKILRLLIIIAILSLN